MSHYKDIVAEIAEEYAWEMFGASFYECTDEQQEEAWLAAEEGYMDNLYSAADALADTRKEERR